TAAAHAEVIATESRGNPFLLHELCRHHRESAGEAGLPERGATLQDVISARLARVPDDAQKLLEVIALAGRPISEAVVVRAAGLGADGLLALTALRGAHLVRTAIAGGGDRLEAYHDRIGEAVARGLEPAVQNRLHLCLAEALDASGQADPEVLAEHFRAAGELARAGRYALAGATQAARTLAFDRAAELYQL